MGSTRDNWQDREPLLVKIKRYIEISTTPGAVLRILARDRQVSKIGGVRRGAERSETGTPSLPPNRVSNYEHGEDKR
jgi:hypothetical protein